MRGWRLLGGSAWRGYVFAGYGVERLWVSNQLHQFVAPRPSRLLSPLAKDGSGGWRRKTEKDNVERKVIFAVDWLIGRGFQAGLVRCFFGFR